MTFWHFLIYFIYLFLFLKEKRYSTEWTYFILFKKGFTLIYIVKIICIYKILLSIRRKNELQMYIFYSKNINNCCVFTIYFRRFYNKTLFFVTYIDVLLNYLVISFMFFYAYVLWNFYTINLRLGWIKKRFMEKWYENPEFPQVFELKTLERMGKTLANMSRRSPIECFANWECIAPLWIHSSIKQENLQKGSAVL